MARYLITLLVTLIVSLVKSDTCYNNVNGKKEKFCCNNSELKENDCVECQDGFISRNGEPCKRCQNGFFGRKCSGKCSSCNETQSKGALDCKYKNNRVSCIFTTGCVDLHQGLSTNELTTGTFTKGIFSTAAEKTLGGISSTTTEKTIKEIAVGEITLYALTALSAMTLISLCLCLLCMARYYSYNLKRKKNNERNEQGDDIGNVYDYADENIMLNQIDIFRLQNTRQPNRPYENEMPFPSVPLQRENSRTSLNDGYLQSVSSATSKKRALPCESSRTSPNDEYLQPITSTNPLTGKSLFTSSSANHKSADVSTPKHPLKYPYMQLDRNKILVHHDASRQPAYLELVDDKATTSGLVDENATILDVVGGSASLPSVFSVKGNINGQSKSDKSLFVNTTITNPNNNNRKLSMTF